MKQLVSSTFKGYRNLIFWSLVVHSVRRTIRLLQVREQMVTFTDTEAVAMTVAGFGHRHPIAVNGPMSLRWNAYELWYWRPQLESLFDKAAAVDSGKHVLEVLTGLGSMPLKHEDKVRIAESVARVARQTHAHLEFANFDEHFQSGSNVLTIDPLALLNSLEALSDERLGDYCKGQSVSFWKQVVVALDALPSHPAAIRITSSSDELVQRSLIVGVDQVRRTMPAAVYDRVLEKLLNLYPTLKR